MQLNISSRIRTSIAGHAMAFHAAELIDFLDQHWCSVMAAHAAHHPLGKTPEDTLCKLEELRQSFHNDLSQMSPEQLIATAKDVMIELDQARPFNRLGTDADYEHFGRCAFLNVPEAVALSLGKDPRFVTWAMVKPYLGTSIFAFEYAKRLDLIERAVIWQELPEFFSPLQFLTWAHQYKLPVPDAFIQRTFDRGEPIQYWHDLCEALHGSNLKLCAELEAAHDALATLQTENDEHAQRTFEEWLDGQDQIDRLNGEHEMQLASLQDALAHAKIQNALLLEQNNAKAAEPPMDEALATIERKSLLTIVIASAVGGFGYDPKSNKSPAPQEIASEAQRLGLKTTDDTVRKYLKEATKISGFVSPDMTHRKPKSVRQKPKSV